MKKYVILILRIGTAAAGLAYIAYALNWQDHTDIEGAFHPGILTTLKGADLRLLLLGFVMTGMVYPILGVRWWLLLRARGLPCSLWNAFRLSMVGCFFNYCMPGTTGGDLVKAYYAAKGSDRKADAVISVVVDRVIGLLGLFVVAGVTGLFMLHEPGARHVTIFIWGTGLTGAIGASVYFSQRLRRLFYLDSLIQKLPGGALLTKVDAAAVAYRHHLPTVFSALGMATVLHLILASATAISGLALGMTIPLGLLLTVIPALFLGAAVPISYQGLGIMEAIGKELLVSPPLCTVNQLVGMLMLTRLYQILYSLIGAVFVLRGNIHLHPKDVAEPDQTENEASSQAN